MTNFALRIILMSILASLFGRAIAADPQAGQILTEERFVDIDLPISDYRFSKDGVLTVVARGKINNQVIAIAVDLESEWKEQIVEDAALTIYWGNGAIRSIGDESDAFLNLLIHEYGLAGNKSKMAPRTMITMAGLNSDPRNIKTDPVTIKVFFEHNGEGNYGEAFINIDLAKRILEFHDKDPEYHLGIASSLAGEM